MAPRVVVDAASSWADAACMGVAIAVRHLKPVRMAGAWHLHPYTATVVRGSCMGKGIRSCTSNSVLQQQQQQLAGLGLRDSAQIMYGDNTSYASGVM